MYAALDLNFHSSPMSTSVNIEWDKVRPGHSIVDSEGMQWLSGEIIDFQLAPNVNLNTLFTTGPFPLLSLVKKSRITNFFVEKQTTYLSTDHMGWRANRMLVASPGASYASTACSLLAKSHHSWCYGDKNAYARAEKDCIRRISTNLYVKHLLRTYQTHLRYLAYSPSMKISRGTFNEHVDRVLNMRVMFPFFHSLFFG